MINRFRDDHYETIKKMFKSYDFESLEKYLNSLSNNVDFSYYGLHHIGISFNKYPYSAFGGIDIFPPQDVQVFNYPEEQGQRIMIKVTIPSLLTSQESRKLNEELRLIYPNVTRSKSYNKHYKSFMYIFYTYNVHDIQTILETFNKYLPL